MKIGVGIDTGGTCTDGVVYELEEKRILAAAKTATTKEDLSVGIGKVLDLLPRDLLENAHVVALSTTLATNACVENKGGRGKLIFLGIDPKSIRQTGGAFGLPLDDTLIFVDCKVNGSGEILEEPDWMLLKERLKEELKDTQSVGIVELFANATGAALEKKTRELVETLGLPCVCGYELFHEKNIVGRGAGTLLNARLIFVIADFLKAVKLSMKQRRISAPVVIVRSDGSLMTEELSRTRPIETLLCGPVASVKGAAELYHVKDGIVIDMGGTTTDISLIKDGIPVRSEGGITVGNWTTYVSGLFVDTFGLGGDSEILLGQEGELVVGSKRVMPMCMASARYPKVGEILRRAAREEEKRYSWRKNIYVGLKQITTDSTYTKLERKVAEAFYNNPMTLEELEEKHGCSVYVDSLKRLISENVLIRCGITPTDAMHVLGDFNEYDTQASLDALTHLGQLMGMGAEELSGQIYREVEKKLYCNILRILVQDRYPKMKKHGIGPEMEQMFADQFERVTGQRGGERESKQPEFLQASFCCDVPLIGVGAPIGVFLSAVAVLLGTKVLLGSYAQVANALGAVVGNVDVQMSMEILPGPGIEQYRVFGYGESCCTDSLEEARETASALALCLAKAEALRRGAVEGKLVASVKHSLVEVGTAYGGTIFLSETVTACVSGSMGEEKY